MNKIIKFLRESRDEMTQHVSWMKYSELQKSSLVVLVASMIFALAIGVTDFAFDRGLGFIYNTFIK